MGKNSCLERTFDGLRRKKKLKDINHHKFYPSGIINSHDKKKILISKAVVAVVTHNYCDYLSNASFLLHFRWFSISEHVLDSSVRFITVFITRLRVILMIIFSLSSLSINPSNHHRWNRYHLFLYNLCIRSISIMLAGNWIRHKSSRMALNEKNCFLQPHQVLHMAYQPRTSIDFVIPKLFV